MIDVFDTGRATDDDGSLEEEVQTLQLVETDEEPDEDGEIDYLLQAIPRIRRDARCATSNQTLSRCE